MIKILLKVKEPRLKIKLIQLDKNLKGSTQKEGLKFLKIDFNSDIDFSVPIIELEKWIKKRYINEITMFILVLEHIKFIEVKFFAY